MDSAFNSLTAVLWRHQLFTPYRAVPPMGKLLLSAFDKSDQGFPSETAIAAIGCQMLILHARDDPLIPYTLAEQLKAAAEAAHRRVHLELFSAHLGLGHNNVHDAPDIPLILWYPQGGANSLIK